MNFSMRRERFLKKSSGSVNISYGSGSYVNISVAIQKNKGMLQKQLKETFWIVDTLIT